MDLGTSTGRLLPNIGTATAVPTIDAGEFDLDSVLSVSQIRTHTKTDDVPNVTDDQLRLYRKAAFEGAEHYTGMLFTCNKSHTEDIAQRGTENSGRIRSRQTMQHRLQYPVANGIVYLYGSRDGLSNTTLQVTPGSRTIKIPIMYNVIDDRSCCDPGRSGVLGANYGMKALYLAGFTSASQIPAGIIVGVLKWIAWQIMHPGDEIMTVRGTTDSSKSGITGTNNVAWASGALELWRQYDSEAI